MKKSAKPKRIENRRARHDYQLGDSFVVGVQLTGGETKALRRGQGHIKGSYVTVKDNELWLINATITGDGSVRVREQDQTRPRKLLAKRKEIDHLINLKKDGQTIVPLELLTSSKYIKVRISAGKGKKKYDKRESLKKRTQQREIDRNLRI